MSTNNKNILKNLILLLLIENTAYIILSVKNLINCANSKCLKLVRCSSLNKIEIQRTLETNPDGILIPQISSFRDAEQAIEHSFYPPIGKRD